MNYHKNSHITPGEGHLSQSDCEQTDSISLPHADRHAKASPTHSKGGFPKPIWLSYEAWFGTFRPLTNHLDPQAAYGGCLFDISCAELEFLRIQPPSRVWTLVDCEGEDRICEGVRFVNRLGYFVTEIGRNEAHFEVYTDEESFEADIFPALPEGGLDDE